MQLTGFAAVFSSQPSPRESNSTRPGKSLRDWAEETADVKDALPRKLDYSNNLTSEIVRKPSNYSDLI